MAEKPPSLNPRKICSAAVSAAISLVLVAAAARITWSLLAPLVPILVSLVVVLFVLWVALFGLRK